MLFIIIFLFLVFLISSLFIIGYNTYASAVKKDNKSSKKSFEKSGLSGESRLVQVNIDWFKEQDIKDLTIQSSDGLKLHGVYLAAKNPYRTVICVHGYRSDAMTDFSSMIKYFNLNHSNILLIDQRCHGESEGDYITFGAKESDDLKLWINTVISRIDDKLPIYLYGISMGSTTSLLTLKNKLPFQVKGVIADCGYSSMKDELSYLLSRYMHIPAFSIMGIINMFCTMSAHFSMSDTEVKEALKDNHIPILYIHGEDDKFVLPENTRQNYANTNSNKDILWVKGATHGDSCIKDPTLYRARLEHFFNTYK